ncbi:MAG: helix-turn-helix domain-containing protein [Pseudomonadota bacterium]
MPQASTLAKAQPAQGVKNVPGTKGAMGAQNCPVTKCLAVIGGKDKPLILFLIARGVNHFGALHRQSGEISKHLLTQNLRQLEGDGLLHRKVFVQGFRASPASGRI